MKRRTPVLLALLLVALTALPVAAQNVATFEKNLTVHKLDNGLTFLIYRRPVAPVFSFFTFVDVGAAQEVPGITGLAHMFEHMAFKGTKVIGTKDYPREKAAMAAVDAAYHAYDDERRKPGGSDPAKLEELKKTWKEAQDAADAFIEKNEFSKIVDQAGGVGMNASTGSDRTIYFYSLPANKVELWAYLESSRFLDPVFREFYKERDVVMEERRMRTESSPFGRLYEQFIGTAFLAHPYKQPVIGYMSDLKSFSREDAEAFFKKYYVPADMTIAVVGDVRADKIIPIIDEYFGRIPAGPKPEALRTVEPPQTAEKEVVLYDPSQPVFLEAYHRPSGTDPDDAVYDVIAEILSTGHTSRLYKDLVRDKKIAVAVGVYSAFPGSKYPCLIGIRALPSPGHTNAEVEAAIHAELDRLKTQPVGDEELKKVKTQAKADLIRGLDDNRGIAAQLAIAQARYGDWREIFRYVDRVDKVSKEDIMRVAKTTFVATNRTIGRIEHAETPEAGAEKGGTR